MDILVAEVYVNGVRRNDIVVDDIDPTMDIIGLLEKEKSVNTSIAALYNNEKHVIDVVKGKDEIETVSKLSILIREYPYDLFDASLFGVANTSYARTAFNFTNMQFKLMGSLCKKPKYASLIKKASY